jgi:tetratricopeptide (TPR) repeat protein
MMCVSLRNERVFVGYRSWQRNAIIINQIVFWHAEFVHGDCMFGEVDSNIGATHWRKAMSAFQTGMKQFRSQNWQEARDALEKALPDQKIAADHYEKSGIAIFNRHLTYGLIASKLGIAYNRCGQFEQSEAILRSTIESYDSAGKLDSTDMQSLLESLHELAVVLRSLGRMEEARVFEHRCGELSKLQQVRTTNPDSKSKIQVLIFAPFFFFLATMSLISCSSELPQAYTVWAQGPTSARWPSVPARIVTCESSTNSSSGQIYKVDLEYEYTVDGKKYSSSRYGWNGWNDQASDSFAKEHKAGDAIVVRVSPGHPEVAVFDSTFQPNLALGAFLKCGILILLALIFYGFCGWAVYGTFIAPSRRKAD